MQATYYIYILRNPNNQEIFYVGTTVNPPTRLRCHCIYPNQCFRLTSTAPSDRLSAKERYILENAIIPVMEVVDMKTIETKYRSSHEKEIVALEEKWINKLLGEGNPLTNKRGIVMPPVKYSIGQTITL